LPLSEPEGSVTFCSDIFFGAGVPGNMKSCPGLWGVRFEWSQFS